MTASIREKQLHGSAVEVLSRGEDCTTYRLADESGAVVMTSYSVFPGIDLIYNDVHIRSSAVNRADINSILEIDHCREGRIECEFQGKFLYLSPGDLSIHRKLDNVSFFPLSHYHGITIMIDLERAPCCLACLMNGIDVCPRTLAEKFCCGTNCFLMRARPCIEHIFSELYSVPDCIRRGYFKVKILELMLFLNGIDPLPEQHIILSKAQVELAKSTCRFLSDHLDAKVTIPQIAKHLHVSETQIKSCFKGVYGVPVYAYARSEKMRSAALMLKTTDSTVLEVAGKYGYDNGSKFAKAFRDVMGISPNEYRTRERGSLI